MHLFSFRILIADDKFLGTSFNGYVVNELPLALVENFSCFFTIDSELLYLAKFDLLELLKDHLGMAFSVLLLFIIVDVCCY